MTHFFISAQPVHPHRVPAPTFDFQHKGRFPFCKIYFRFSSFIFFPLFFLSQSPLIPFRGRVETMSTLFFYLNAFFYFDRWAFILLTRDMNSYSFNVTYSGGRSETAYCPGASVADALATLAIRLANTKADIASISFVRVVGL